MVKTQDNSIIYALFVQQIKKVPAKMTINKYCIFF